MAIEGRIIPLKDSDGGYIFPETSSQAVYCNDGKTIDEKLESSIFLGEHRDDVSLQRPEAAEKLDKINSDISEINSQLEQKAINVMLFKTFVKNNDWSDAIQNAINYANGNDRSEQIILELPKGIFEVGKKISVPQNTTLRIKGQWSKSTYIRPKTGFSDNCIFELNGTNKSIYIKDLSFSGGNEFKKVSAIEFIGGSHGQLYVDNVGCSGLRYLIRGGKTSEFPLGGTFKDIYCLDNYIGGIYLGTETSPNSGQSCFTFDNIIVSSPNVIPTEYDTFSKTTSGTTDTIAINNNGDMEDFGAILMRRESGGDWDFVHWIDKEDSTTSVSLPNNSKTYEYRLVQNSVGIFLNYLKVVNLGAIQCEYVGFGLYLKNCRAVSLNTFYHEYRNGDFSSPRPQGYGIFLNSVESFSLEETWIDGAYNGLYSYNCESVNIDCITAGIINSVICSHQINENQLLTVNKVIKKKGLNKISHIDNSYKNYILRDIVVGRSVTELSGVSGSELILTHRGNKKGKIVADNNGLQIECDYLNSNISIAKQIKPIITNVYQKQITNNTTVSLLTFKAQQFLSITFNYTIRAIDGVIRQNVSGECTVDIALTDIYRSSIYSIVKNKIQQAGTITDPIFTLSIEDDICTLNVLVNSSNCTDVRCGITPVVSNGKESPLITLL